MTADRLAEEMVGTLDVARGRLVAIAGFETRNTQLTRLMLYH